MLTAWVLTVTGSPPINCPNKACKPLPSMKEHTNNQDSLPCKKILGYDASILYLSAIMQELPAKHCIRYKEEDNYKPHPYRKCGFLALEWLSWLEISNHIQIQHAFNKSEKVIGSMQILVDEICEETKTIYQFFGCLWHGHQCALNVDKHGNMKTLNQVNGKLMSTLRKDTEDITNYLRDEGHAVVTIHEYQWLNHKSYNRVIQEVLKTTVKIVRPRRNRNSQSILNGVLTGKLFGVLLCNIHKPDHLKKHFPNSV